MFFNHYFPYLDIDECTVGSTCSHKCTNTNGSFTCSCFNGYKLQNDGHSCEGKKKHIAVSK